MKTALIISLNFHPGHVSHMVASYKQCEELGYQSIYFVDPQFENFLPKGSRIMKNGQSSCPITDLVIFLFPSQKNLPLIWKMKHKGGEGGIYIPRTAVANEGLPKGWFFLQISCKVVGD